MNSCKHHPYFFPEKSGISPFFAAPLERLDSWYFQIFFCDCKKIYVPMQAQKEIAYARIGSTGPRSPEF